MPLNAYCKTVTFMVCELHLNGKLRCRGPVEEKGVAKRLCGADPGALTSGSMPCSAASELCDPPLLIHLSAPQFPRLESRDGDIQGSGED